MRIVLIGWQIEKKATKMPAGISILRTPMRYTYPISVVLLGFFVSCQAVFAVPQQDLLQPSETQTQSTETDPESPPTPKKVDVNPIAKDEEIADRLRRILEATGWFIDPRVRVDEGVVFLGGGVEKDLHREWASNLANNTQDVVAVVNRIEVVEKSMWDLTPAWDELRDLGRATIRNSPLVGFAILCLILTWLATVGTARLVARILAGRMQSPLLSDVVARGIALPVFLVGLYLILRISGLSRLAMTVIGGTGLVALVIGFAFRDIAENFLASILISIQHPFARDDLIEVAGYKGYVQSVNTRSALIMTLEGNYVQIPNATIYKEPITNFTANPNVRFDFTVGIGYEDSITRAQEIIMKVLRDHPAVVDQPESLVLVENLGAATVTLRVYFWIDIAQYSAFKVQSAVIRLTKHALEKAGVSMPDEAREIIFPAGVPVQITSSETETSTADPRSAAGQKTPSASNDAIDKNIEENDEEETAVSRAGEGDLASEAVEISNQARNSRTPEKGQDLLES